MKRFVICALAALGVLLAWGVAASSHSAPLTIDYPLEGSIFPPDFAAPTFLWRDPAPEADKWQIEVAFSDGSQPLLIQAPGDPMRIGEIDPRCIGPTNQPPKLTPEQAASRTWAPQAAVWAEIKRHSAERPATVTITGLSNDNTPVSSGRATPGR